MLPEPVAVDLAELLPRFAALGCVPTRGEYDHASFGNYFVDFESPSRSFRITRDRSQYILGGDRAGLEPAGLWRAFDSQVEFADAVVAWLGAS